MNTGAEVTLSATGLAAVPNRRARTAHNRVFGNIGANWVGYGVTFAVGVVIAPLMVHKLGDAAYGLWAVALQIGAYLSVLDLGVRSAVNRYLTHHEALGESDQIDLVMSVGLLVLGGFALLCTVAGTVAAWYVPRFISIPPEMVTAARWTVLVVVLQVAISFPGAMFQGALAALSRYDLMNLRVVFTAAMRGALIWFFLVRGYGLLAVAVITGVVTVSGYFIELGMAWRVYSGFRLRVYRSRFWNCFVTLFRFSFFAFLLSIASRLLLWSDNLVAGIVLGPVAVTFYAIGGNLVDYVRNILNGVTCIFVPLATSLDAGQDLAGLRSLLSRGSRMSLTLIMPAVAGFFILGKPFIALWMGARYAPLSGLILAMLTVPLLMAPCLATCNQILYGMNRHRIYAYMAVGEALANLTLSVVLAKRIGLIGIAWGTVIPALVVEGFFVPCYTAEQVGMAKLELYRDALLRPLMAGVPCAALFVVARSLHLASQWPGFVSIVVLGCLVYLASAWNIALAAPEREIVWTRIAVMRQRLVAN